MFRFISIFISFFAIGISFTYHAKKSLQTQACQQEISESMQKSDNYLKNDIEDCVRDLKEWQRINPENVRYLRFSKKIIDDCNAFREKIAHYEQQIKVKLIDDKLQSHYRLPVKTVDSCIALHYRINKRFARYLRDSSLCSVPNLLDRVADSSSERTFATVAAKLNSLNGEQQKRFLAIEKLRLRHLEYILIHQLLNLPSRPKIDNLDKILIVCAPQKASVRLGEKFECEIKSLSYSSKTNNIRMQANGEEVKLKNGLARLNVPLNQTGKYHLTYLSILSNTQTGATTSSQNEVQYDVIE